jgi:hypothetical protein
MRVCGRHRAALPEGGTARRLLARLTVGDASRVARLNLVLPSAFHRVVQRTAPPSTSRSESSPAAVPRDEGFGAGLPGPAHGPPSWFLTTLTGCASERFAGLLHPAADHGVHRVAAPPSHLPVPGRELSPRCSTLQSLPLPRSHSRVTAAALPPRGHQVRTWTRLEALLHARVRCVPRRCRLDPPDALLGFPL